MSLGRRSADSLRLLGLLGIGCEKRSVHTSPVRAETWSKYFFLLVQVSALVLTVAQSVAHCPRCEGMRLCCAVLAQLLSNPLVCWVDCRSPRQQGCVTIVEHAAPARFGTSHQKSMQPVVRQLIPAGDYAHHSSEYWTLCWAARDGL